MDRTGPSWPAGGNRLNDYVHLTAQDRASNRRSGDPISSSADGSVSLEHASARHRAVARHASIACLGATGFKRAQLRYRTVRLTPVQQRRGVCLDAEMVLLHRICRHATARRPRTRRTPATGTAPCRARSDRFSAVIALEPLVRFDRADGAGPTRAHTRAVSDYRGAPEIAAVTQPVYLGLQPPHPENQEPVGQTASTSAPRNDLP